MRVHSRSMKNNGILLHVFNIDGNCCTILCVASNINETRCIVLHFGSKSMIMGVPSPIFFRNEWKSLRRLASSSKINECQSLYRRVLIFIRSQWKCVPSGVSFIVVFKSFIGGAISKWTSPRAHCKTQVNAIPHEIQHHVHCNNFRSARLWMFPNLWYDASKKTVLSVDLTSYHDSPIIFIWCDHLWQKFTSSSVV